MNRPEKKANRAGMSDPSGRKAAGGLVRHLRPSRLPFCVSAAALAAAAFAASGSAASGPAPAQPIGLQSFVKRLDEPRRLAAPNVPEYSRTPSFAWAPARGATALRVPALHERSVPRPQRARLVEQDAADPCDHGSALAAMDHGDPASLYWRVRAVSGGSISPWSDAQPFTMRWPDAPTRMAARERVAGRHARLRPLAHRRRSHRLPGVIRERRQGHHDDHERGRRARVLRASRHGRLDR